MPPTLWFDYQAENFDPPPDDELMCSICRCVFFDPVECPCRHVFCKSCITQWLTNHKSCPACRKRISKSTLQDVVPLIRNMIMKLTLRCRNSDKGCEAKCTVELYESHLKSCSYEIVKCGNGTCCASILRMDKEHHEGVECLYRTVPCKRCKLNVVVSAQLSHDCIRDLLRIVQEKDARIAELQQETDKLKKEIEDHKKEMEKSKISVHTSSDSSNFGSVSSVSITPSSSNESDLEDYSVRIFSVVHPNDSISMSANIVTEPQSFASSGQDLNSTEEFLPMDAAADSYYFNNESPKSPSPDYLDSDRYFPVLSPSTRGSPGQASNSNVLDTEGFLTSPKRPLKRRLLDSTENSVSLDQSARSDPSRSPFYDNFMFPARFRASYSDTESPRTLSQSANAFSRPKFQNQDRGSARLVNETIEILDTSTEDVTNLNACPVSVPSSSYAVSESSQGSNPPLNSTASGSRTETLQERYRPKFFKHKGSKGFRGKLRHVGSKNSSSAVPHSRVPLAIINPGSSSTPVLSGPNILQCKNSSSSDERGSSHALTPNTGLKNTLSLLTKYASKESDPDWVASDDCGEGSDTDSTSTSSSRVKTPPRVMSEALRHFSPSHNRESSDSSSDDSESWSTDVSETDSSYEVEVPPTAWDLIQRYCGGEDSEDDSEWVPTAASNAC